MDRILQLPPEGQGIAMAKLLMENPEIQDQLDKIVATLRVLASYLSTFSRASY